MSKRSCVAAVAAALMLSATALGGCQRVFDSDKLEENITTELAKQTGVTPTAVRCPDDQPEKVGGSFTCEADAPGGGTAIVVVKMLGEGNVEWEVTGTR